MNAPPGTANEDKLIDFFVLDPNYQVIFSRRKHEEGIIRFNTTMPGQYTFVFSNMKDRFNSKSVTLALHPGYDTETTEEKKSIEEETKQMSFNKQ